MSADDSPKGFSGLSGMVTEDPVGSAPAAAAEPGYQMISLTKTPSLAAPWSGDGPGEGWKWGDYYVTVQTRPVTQAEFMAAKMAGKSEKWDGLEYLYSATVFRDPEKNEYGRSSRPVLVIAIEKSGYGTMVGVFDGDVRSNLGGYAGGPGVDQARATFFDFIGKRFALTGQPERLGTIEAVRPKVVTRDVSKMFGEGGNKEPSGAGILAKLPSGLLKGKGVPAAAALALLLAWGFYAKPEFLSFAFGYDSFEDCVLHRMKGQPSNLVGVARSACSKTNPPDTLIERSRLEFDWNADGLVMKRIPNGVELSRIDGEFYEKECPSGGRYEVPGVKSSAKKGLFSDKFEFDIPIGRFGCAYFDFYGKERK
jgi:hypothetical protein